MKQIKQAVYGAFALALATAPAIVGAQWYQGKTNAAQSGLAEDSIYNIISRTMNWLLAILGFIGIIGFVIAGILYLTAAGDEGQIEKAKNAMMYSIIGIIIIQAVEGWLTSGSTQF